MNHAQSSKSLFGTGAALLSLSLGATLLFFTLKPNHDSLQDEQPEKVSPRKVVKLSPPAETLPAPADVRVRTESLPTPVVPVEPKPDHSDEGGVEVIEPGRIRLSEEQTELLRGRGASWGQDNTEADAVLRSIPKEAFTSDW